MTGGFLFGTAAIGSEPLRIDNLVRYRSGNCCKLISHEQESGALLKDAAIVLNWSDAVIKLATRFAADESGATAIEYGLIAALIAIAIIASVGALGTAISDKFTYVQGKVVAAK